VIELDENFYDQGEDMTGEWRGQEISVENSYSDMNGPPAHCNCRCVLIGMVDEGPGAE
jgi:hypothetical protein